MQEKKIFLAQDLVKDCKSVEDVHNPLKDLFKWTIEEVLEGELSEHLGYKKYKLLGYLSKASAVLSLKYGNNTLWKDGFGKEMNEMPKKVKGFKQNKGPNSKIEQPEFLGEAKLADKQSGRAPESRE